MPDGIDTFITHWGVAIHPWSTCIDMTATVAITAGMNNIATSPLFRVAFPSNADTELERRVVRLEKALEYNLITATPQDEPIHVGQGCSFSAKITGPYPEYVYATAVTMALIIGGRQAPVDNGY